MPDLVIFAGPNGSGKSTIFSAVNNSQRYHWSVQPNYIPPENYINPDEIVLAYNVESVMAGRIAIEKIRSHLANSSDFAIETTFSGLTYLRYIQEAAEKGYRIYIIYMFLDSEELSMLRVAQRAFLGKHYIAMADIQRRYAQSLKNFFERYAACAYFWLVVDNCRMEIAPLCWGGHFFKGSMCSNDPEKLEILKGHLRDKGITPYWAKQQVYADSSSVEVFHAIRNSVLAEVSRRPMENRVAVSLDGKIVFVNPVRRVDS